MIFDPTAWTVDIREVSAGVYRGRAQEAAGRTVERTGTDPEALRQELLARAEKMVDLGPVRGTGT